MLIVNRSETEALLDLDALRDAVAAAMIDVSTGRASMPPRIAALVQSRNSLLDAVLRASRDAGRELQILEEGHQAADHPVHPAIPETSYLKAFFARTI